GCLDPGGAVSGVSRRGGGARRARRDTALSRRLSRLRCAEPAAPRAAGLPHPCRRGADRRHRSGRPAGCASPGSGLSGAISRWRQITPRAGCRGLRGDLTCRTRTGSRFIEMRSLSLAALAMPLVLLALLGGTEAAQRFNALDFQFESGSVMSDLHIAYETQGTLSPARDNAILLIPGAIGDRHVFDPLIGPGKTFDTDRYFVITLDPLGGGESTSPADGMGQEFPRYTIRDMMQAQQALVT